MRSERLLRRILAAGVSLCALGGAALADDAADLHREIEELRQEVKQLRSELHSVKADTAHHRKAAEESNSAEAAPVARPKHKHGDNAPASAPADGSTPTNAQLFQRVEALEGELQQSKVQQAQDHTIIAAQSTSPGWWNNTSIGGIMFYDFTNVKHESDGSTNKLTDNGVSFDIKRFYIIIDHKFDDVFSANVTTDFTYDSTTGASQIFIKKAYLQAKLDDAFIIRAGSSELPWTSLSESLYGYRYIENVLTDRTKFASTADWGIHVLGKLGDGGWLQYAVSAINGAGFKKANLFRTNQPDIEGRISAKLDNFTFGLGGYIGKLGVQHGTDTFHTATRFDAIAAYTTDTLRLGIEYFHASNYLDVTKQTTDSDNGISVFGSYVFAPKWSVFGRYDWVAPHTSSQNDVKENYFNLGISWEPVKTVDFALVYKRDSVDDGFYTTSNGVIGGVDADSDGTYDEVGLWGQVKW